jgi:RHS repeat-associated protein
VVKTSALGRATTYRTEELATGDTRVTVTDPAGLATVSLQGQGGSRTTTTPDGTLATASQGPDPRFGMLSPRLETLTVTTPGGLASTTTSTRTATFVDPAGDPKEPANVASVTDTVTVNGKTATSVQDLVARRTTTTSPEGRQSTTTLDVFGRPTEIALPGVAPVQYGYEARGRLQTLTQGTRTTTYTYDPATGFVSKITDPAAREVSFTYDLAGRVKTQTLPDSRVVSFSYDPSGNVTSITPPGRPAHAFGHTPIDLPETYTPPDVGLAEHATTLAYNADRQVELVTRPDGQTIDSVYDPASGRLTSVVTPRGSYGYSYDATTGNLTTATDPAGGALAYGYDGALPTSVTWTGEVAGSVGFGYDDDFELVSRTVNGTDSVAFDHDQDGLLTVAGALTLSHAPATGFLAGSTLGSLTDSYTYDPIFGELSSYSAADGGTELYATTYTRDELGRIEQKVETIGGVTATYDYTFDLAGRLTDVEKDGIPQAHYDYDANSNRTAWTDPWGSGTATYDGQDRLTSYAGTTYTYTANGELASKSAGGQTVTYDYGVLGNLRQVVLADGLTIDYVIDAAGRRVGKKVGGVLAQGFLYQDGLNPVAELDGTGAVVSTFVYASKPNVPDYLVKAGTTYRLIADPLGSIRLVVNATDGTVAQRLDYDAFGRVMLDTNPGFQPFGFAGGLYDPQTGLLRFGARDYDPETGRWTSKDPIGFGGGGSNLYGYVLIDPVNRVDPSGLVSPGTDPSSVAMETLGWLVANGKASVGISADISTINPFTSGGGVVYGVNLQYLPEEGLRLYTYGTHPDQSSAGFEVGGAFLVNAAFGEGAWAGDFDTYSAAAFLGQVGYFESPPTQVCGDNPGWQGLQGGYAPGYPGAGATQVEYKPVRWFETLRLEVGLLLDLLRARLD